MARGLYRRERKICGGPTLYVSVPKMIKLFYGPRIEISDFL
jgi:hypothetical protein